MKGRSSLVDQGLFFTLHSAIASCNIITPDQLLMISLSLQRIMLYYLNIIIKGLIPMDTARSPPMPTQIKCHKIPCPTNAFG